MGLSRPLVAGAPPRRASDDGWPPIPFVRPKRRLVAVISCTSHIVDMYRRSVPVWLTVNAYEDLAALVKQGLPTPEATLFVVVAESAWVTIARCSWLKSVLGAIVLTAPGGKDTRPSFRRGDEVIYTALPLTEAKAKECNSAMLYLSGQSQYQPVKGTAGGSVNTTKLETESLRSSTCNLEVVVEVKANLIKLYERQLGRFNQSSGRTQSKHFDQLHVLLHRDSKVNRDGSVNISTQEPVTPPESPKCSPSPSVEIDVGPLDDEEPTASPSTRDRLLAKDFPIFQHNDDELVRYIWPIFESFGLTKNLKLDAVKFAVFVREVKNRYQANHYHNFRHAFDVLQTVSVMVRTCSGFMLPDVTLLGLLVAALCHDIKHPGLTNAFLVKAKSPVATLYNGQSVLENFHALSTIALLDEPECDILAALSPSDRESCEATIVEAILWTDMSMHKEKLGVFADMIESKRTLGEKEHNIIAAMLLKCSDVSNVWKPWKQSLKWSSLLVEEWRVQGDMEAALFGERVNGPPPEIGVEELPSFIGKNTANFIGQFVEPMVTLLSARMPSLRDSFAGLAENTMLYRELENSSRA